MILEEAGTDATKAFDESAHTPDAKQIMAKFKIGELVEVTIGLVFHHHRSIHRAVCSMLSPALDARAMGI